MANLVFLDRLLVVGHGESAEVRQHPIPYRTPTHVAGDSETAGCLIHRLHNLEVVVESPRTAPLFHAPRSHGMGVAVRLNQMLGLERASRALGQIFFLTGQRPIRFQNDPVLSRDGDAQLDALPQRGSRVLSRSLDFAPCL